MVSEVKSTTNDRLVDVIVPPAEELAIDEIRAIVGAKNVMGTCSG
ncbi:MAG: hypothetical protein ACRDZO_03200 [Egibacteraceae bacterium]